jgi:uncharacterized membrane protein YjjP (DUF1212 family)
VTASTPDPAGHHRPAPAVALRRAASRVVRSSSPPTIPIAVRGGGDTLDDAKARAVLDLALRLGEALLSTGAPASDVTATVLRLADAYGLRSCHVDITFTSVTVSYHRGEDDDPMTVLRIVRVRSSDYTRLENLQALVRDAVDGRLDVASARARLDEVVRAPHPYRRWLVTGALAGLGAAVTALLGGGLAMMVLTALTTAVIDRVQRLLTRAGLPAFFTQAVGGAIPTTVAVGLLVVVSRTSLTLEQFSPSLVVASGIVVLLAGLGVLGAAQDAIDGYYVTAGARGFEVLVLTLGIVVGIGFVLAVAQKAGVPMEISPVASVSTNLGVQAAAAVAVAAFFAFSAYTRARGALLAAGVGGIGWVMYQVASALGAGPSTASGCAAAVVGLLAQVIAVRFRVPVLAVSTAGIVPLLPGSAVYRGLFQLVELGPTEGFAPGMTTLLGAAGVGMGLAAGVSLGNFVGRPLRSELDRWEQRALRRSTGARD